MPFGPRHLPEFCLLVVALFSESVLLWGILKTNKARGRTRVAMMAPAGLVAMLLCMGFALRSIRISSHFPLLFTVWVRGLALTSALLLAGAVIAYGISRLVPAVGAAHNGSRRLFLRAARVSLFAAPAAALGYGTFVQRSRFRVREVDVPVPGLPKDLDGLVLVQLSDIHLSPFLSEAELRRTVDMANETRARVALVTGDLITQRGDPLDTCLKQLARLRADAGVLGCLGNHEVYADAQDYATEKGASMGIRFLRRTSETLRFGSAALHFVGIDYQPMHTRYLVGAERLVRPGALNVLLSHNPDVFPVAARKGYQLTISGHTHGGQVSVEILHQDLNVARFFTPYVYGLYRRGLASIYVTRGIGTIGLPTRIGAPPEVARIRLCAI